MKKVASLKDQCKLLVLESALYTKAVKQGVLPDDLKNELIEAKQNADKLERENQLVKSMVGIINNGHGV